MCSNHHTDVCFWSLQNISGHTAVLLLFGARKGKTETVSPLLGRGSVKKTKKQKRSHRCVALSCFNKTKNEAGSPLFLLCFLIKT